MKRRTAATMTRISTTLLILLAVSLLSPSTHGFTSPISVNSRPQLIPPTICNTPQLVSPHHRRSNNDRSSSSTSLNLLGTDSGILGVGAPEVATILLVGYFVLGPSELYKLVKEIGKFVQNFRSLSTEASKQFESTMENQLELTELRKAQTELNNAFSFRRSINTDEGGEAFQDNELFTEKAAAASAAVAAGTNGEETTTDGTVKKKKRLVRRKKKKVVVEEEQLPNTVDETELANLERDFAMEYPDLDMLDQPPSTEVQEKISEEDRLRSERMERLSGGSSSNNDTPDWFTASEEEIASEVLNTQPTTTTPKDPALEAYEQNRFQSQLSAQDWNAQIMANEDALSPLTMIMQRLAILEEEKNAADKRLEEEFERRMDNEDKFYLEKRRVLEEAIEEVQRNAFGGMSDGNDEKKEEVVEKEEKKVESESETVVNNGPKFSA